MTPNELTGANSSLKREIAQPQHAADGTKYSIPTFKDYQVLIDSGVYQGK